MWTVKLPFVTPPVTQNSRCFLHWLCSSGATVHLKYTRQCQVGSRKWTMNALYCIPVLHKHSVWISPVLLTVLRFVMVFFNPSKPVQGLQSVLALRKFALRNFVHTSFYNEAHSLRFTRHPKSSEQNLTLADENGKRTQGRPVSQCNQRKQCALRCALVSVLWTILLYFCSVCNNMFRIRQ
jgi:hypothetical protein